VQGQLSSLTGCQRGALPVPSDLPDEKAVPVALVTGGENKKLASEVRSRRIRAPIVVVIALGIAVLLALGYASGRGLFPSPPAAPVENLRVALGLTPDAALLHIAAAKGYFADEGLAVTLLPVSHGKVALDLLAQGKADLASAADVPFVISVLKGERLGIAAAVVSVPNEMAVVARRDRGIASSQDLLGKRVGVTFGTNGEYFLWAFLIRHKLAPDSVTLVDLPPGRMARELKNGTIDAVSTWEPIRSEAHAALGDNARSFVGPDAYSASQVVVGRSEFLKARSGAIERLMRALLKAEAFNRSEPQQALALVADLLRLDARALLASGWKDFQLKVDLRQSQLVTLEDEARWAMARGYADKGPIPNFLPHLHLDALLAVQPERVTVVH
jgi:NitT/TauT family transport system substrate-binding protein